MIKVYQDKPNNCTQASVASLLELPIEEVPNFIESKDWAYEEIKFFKSKGFNYAVYHPSMPEDAEELKSKLKEDGGINSCFLATVRLEYGNKTYYHSVIIDSDLNIVFDPCPYEDKIVATYMDIFEVVINNTDITFENEF